MRIGLVQVTALGAVSVIAFELLRSESVLPAPAPASPAPGAAADLLASLPFQFVENKGQLDARVEYATRRPDFSAFFTRDGFALTLPRAGEREANAAPAEGGVNLFFTFEDAPDTATLRGGVELPGRFNYLQGTDSERWIQDARSYDSVRYESVYAGLDVDFHGRGGHLEYDLELEPGFPAEAVVLRCDGAERLELDDSGALVIHTDAGPLRQPAPKTWQTDDAGERQLLACAFRLVDEHRFGFELAGRDPLSPVVIDPVFMFSTFAGGSTCEIGYGVDVDQFGSTYVTGITQFGDYPLVPGAFDTVLGDDEAFVSKLNRTGTTLLYSTFLGGIGDDYGLDVVADFTSRALVVGVTESIDFPTTPGARDSTYGGGDDGFVALLSANGSSLVFGTFLGDAEDDRCTSVQVDVGGAIFVTGSTTSPGFPITPGAFQSVLAGADDVFVTRYAPNGASIDYSTLLGGSENDLAVSVEVEFGSAYVAGTTSSDDFPTTPGAFSTTRSGSDDVFVTQLTPTGDALSFSTYLGGTDDDIARDMVRAVGQSLIVVGRTESDDFPITPGAIYPSPLGFDDAFVTRFSPGGGSLIYSTFLGGDFNDEASSVTTDPVGTAFVTGWTASANFPTTTDGVQQFHGGGADVFFTEVRPLGDSLEYSTYLGGPDDEIGYGIRQDIFTGITSITGHARAGFPTTAGSYDPTYNGGSGDVFVATFKPEPCAIPAQVALLGTGCGANLSSNLPAQATFWKIDLVGATRNSFGLIWFSLPGAPPLPVEGLCSFWLDPFTMKVFTLLNTDATGSWSLTIALPNDPPRCGATLTLQGVVFGTSGPLSFGALTNGLVAQLGS